MKRVEFHKTITQSNAPARLIGKTLLVVVDETKQSIEVTLNEDPGDLDAQEQGYLKYSLGEMFDSMEKETGMDFVVKSSGYVSKE